MPRLLAERTPPENFTPGRPSRRTVTVNLAESPLGWLRARALISDRHFAAGELLRRDYEMAQLGPRVTMRWDAAPAQQSRRGAPDPAGASVAHLSARDRFDAAMSTAGNGLSDILWRVICACEAMPNAEHALGWPARSGRIILTLALDRIADYYRVP